MQVTLSGLDPEQARRILDTLSAPATTPTPYTIPATAMFISDSQWRNNRRLIREQLHRRAGGLCHWCRVQTHVEHVEDRGHATLATIDHLFSVLEPSRHIYRQQPVVLSCWRCNQRRGAEACMAKQAATK